ncbi:glycoside hydrolase family 10 protein [Paraliomyxa miuraensis]|uniref:glycoside hydrolase family 10 protein n=1 Tax=Paraliomyxa miuraensis TaxID=376150 RepID=UPI00225993C1|nr:family 10 glycosylhydrolase [Paraliomyxa miuraensis]MCX4247662.1 family 10 glycosylhydrolase [Paraliomyxa miuraensis]
MPNVARTWGPPCLLGALLLAACADDDPEAWQGPGSGSSDGGTNASDGSATGPTDGPEPDGSSGESSESGGLPPQPLVDVAHDREFRGVWVATVSNINFPSGQGLAADTQRQELVDLLDVMVAHNLNAIVFQVRPEGDAFYDSPIEPWSRFLMGTQGTDPGFDPLAWLIEQAHPRGIEVHAWFNPYRAKVSLASSLAPGHIALDQPAYAYEYGNFLWMDPGAELVQERVIDVILDVVDRYDVDGIHFDDYFYPYPNGDPFPDGSTYADYMGGGGALALDDWRRDNVNQLVEVLYESIVGTRDHVRFGISPFGIYRPGMPPGITGLDQYAEIFADPLLWMDEGWVDYLAPQLYWPTTQTAQAYEPLLEWWSSMTSEGRYIFTGNFLSQIGSSGAWTVDELVTQVELSRIYRDLGSMGNIFFHIEPFVSDSLGVGTALHETFYIAPALTPPMAAKIGTDVAPPWVELDGSTVTLSPQDDTPLRAWVVYEDAGAGFELIDIVPVATATFELPYPGTWAISAAARSGVESRGVLVEVQ